MKKTLAFAAALFCATGAMAQFNIPPVGDPVCAYCGANLPKNEPHSSDCPYYEAPEEEEEETSAPASPPPAQPQQQQPAQPVQPASPPPSPPVNYVPVQPSQPTPPPAQPQQQPAPPQHQAQQQPQRPQFSLSQFRPRTEEEARRERERNRMEHGIWHQDLLQSHRRVVEIRGEGWGVWDTQREFWLLEPRFQRIYMPDGSTAVIQLMADGKWRIRPLRDREAGLSLPPTGPGAALFEAEFDEVKFIDGFPMVALNRRDADGRSHWRVWMQDGWMDDPAVTYSDLRLYKNGATGGYDLLTRTQQGTWDIRVAGHGVMRGLATIERLPNTGAYLISTSEGNRQRYGIVSNTLGTILPADYDRIEPQHGVYIITRNGKTGIAVTETDGERATVSVAVPPQFDHASVRTVRIPALNRNSSYALVGNRQGYAFYSLRYNLQMLPAIFTPDEVRDFETRLITATEPSVPYDDRRRAEATFTTDGTGDFRQYAQGEACRTYGFLTAGIISSREAARRLSESSLRQ